MQKSGINWTDSTFNGWTGCSKIDQECANCYAEVLIDQRYGANRDKRWGTTANRKRTSEANWKQVKKWNSDAASSGKSHFVFCGSLMDVMDDHESIAQGWRDDLLKLIDETPYLTWLLLSKRPENYTVMLKGKQLSWPHVWLGTTCGHDGAKARGRVAALQATDIHPEAQRFVSAEPLLGDLSDMDLSGIGWLIAGGESGGGARPFDLANAWKLYGSCDRQHVNFWFNQIGDVTVDGLDSVHSFSSLHDLSQVPSKYDLMIRRERPEPYRHHAAALAIQDHALLPMEVSVAIKPEHEDAANHDTDERISRWMSVQFPSPAQIAREAELRPGLLSALNAFRKSRFEMGRLLNEYRKTFSGTFDGLLAALGIARSTGFDILSDYGRALAVPEPIRAVAMRRGIDIAEMRHKDLAVKLAASPKFGLSDAEAEVEFEAVHEEVRSANLQLVKGKTKKAYSGPLVQITVATNETESLVADVKSLLGEEMYQARFIAWLKKTLADNSQTEVAA
jgi:protein gp37